MRLIIGLTFACVLLATMIAGLFILLNQIVKTEAELEDLKRTFSKLHSGYKDHLDLLRIYSEYKQSSPYSAIEDLNQTKAELKLLQANYKIALNNINAAMTQLNARAEKNVSAILSTEQNQTEINSSIAILNQRLSALEKAPCLVQCSPLPEPKTTNSDQDIFDALCIDAYELLISRNLADSLRLFEIASQFDSRNKGILLALAIIYTHDRNPHPELGLHYLEAALEAGTEKLPSWFVLDKLPKDYASCLIRNGEIFAIEISTSDARTKKLDPFNNPRVIEVVPDSHPAYLNKPFRSRH